MVDMVRLPRILSKISDAYEVLLADLFRCGQEVGHKRLLDSRLNELTGDTKLITNPCEFIPSLALVVRKGKAHQAP